MAFLDNSGDIILDAVLTDTGRHKLAMGDGSFNIKYFAFSDDEVDYTTYDSTHPSGSAYYDLDIMQTPVLEAFTDNRASMKHRLITSANRNLLYLPVLRLNTILDENVKTMTSAMNSGEGFFGVTVNTATSDLFFTSDGTQSAFGQGIMNGVSGTGTGRAPSNSFIRIDQGLMDTPENTQALDNSLKDSAYLVTIDNRLGSIISSKVPITSPAANYIDDDNIATYYLSTNFVDPLEEHAASSNTPINGRRGTKLQFKIKSRADLADSNVLFNRIGTNKTMNSVNYKVIDSIVRVSGATTGRAIDIPVRFFKQA